MNPERVQLFRIYYVIGKNKTRTGFENHMLSLPRGRLVPCQPRAFKSTTRTELQIWETTIHIINIKLLRVQLVPSCLFLSRLLSCHIVIMMKQ